MTFGSRDARSRIGLRDPSRLPLGTRDVRTSRSALAVPEDWPVGCGYQRAPEAELLLERQGSRHHTGVGATLIL